MQLCFFSKIASVLSHGTVIIPWKAQGQKPSNDTLWSPLLLCHLVNDILFKKVKEKKYIWERNILITQLSTIVLTVDGMTETLQGYFSPMRRKWILISNKLCVRICTHLHKHKHALEVISLEWRLPQTPQALKRLTLPSNRPRTGHELPNFIHANTKTCKTNCVEAAR